MLQHNSNSAHPDKGSATRLWGSALVVVFLALVIPVIWSGAGNTDDAVDQKNYHEPFIMQLQAQWPDVDLVNTHGLAMTPGYHLLLSAMSHYAGISILGMRITTAVLGALLVWTTFWFCAQWAQPRVAFLLTLPLMLSSFVLGSAMWLRPDNISLLAVVVTLGLLTTRQPTPGVVLLLGAVIALAVSVRQVNIWLIAPLALFVFGPLIACQQQLQHQPPFRKYVGERRLIAAAIIAIACPCGVLAYFYILWGGLVPPSAAEVHLSGNRFGNLSVIFSLTGFFGAFFIMLIPRPSLSRLLSDPLVWGAAFAGFLMAVIPQTGVPTAPSGFLIEMQKTPTFYDRVVLLVPFSIMGGIVLALMARATVQSGHGWPALLLFTSFFIWALAMAANVYVFRRYSEPFILILLAWLSALAGPNIKMGQLSFWLFTALMLIQIGMTILKLYLPVLSSV
jgi:hypothetical protein